MKQMRVLLHRRGWTPLLAPVAVVLALAGGFWHTQVIRSRNMAWEQLQAEAARLHEAAGALPPGGELIRLRSRSSGELQQEAAALIGLLGKDLAALEIQDRTVASGVPRVRGDFHLMQVEVGFRASLEQVHGLLERLRDYGPVVRVEKLILNRDPQASDAAGVLVTLMLEVCVIQPGESDGKKS